MNIELKLFLEKTNQLLETGRTEEKLCWRKMKCIVKLARRISKEHKINRSKKGSNEKLMSQRSLSEESLRTNMVDD